MTKQKKQDRFPITASANDMTTVTERFHALATELTDLGKTVREKYHAVSLDQIKSIYLGKGASAGCAAVVKAFCETTDYTLGQYTPIMKDFWAQCGLVIVKGVPTALKLPEGVPTDPSEEGWKLFEKWISENCVFDPKAVETDEEKAKRIEKQQDKDAKKWSGEEGKKNTQLALLNLSKRIGNNKLKKLVFLMGCNLDLIEQTFAEAQANKKLNRKVPEGVNFKE